MSKLINNPESIILQDRINQKIMTPELFEKITKERLQQGKSNTFSLDGKRSDYSALMREERNYDRIQYISRFSYEVPENVTWDLLGINNEIWWSGRVALFMLEVDGVLKQYATPFTFGSRNDLDTHGNRLYSNFTTEGVSGRWRYIRPYVRHGEGVMIGEKDFSDPKKGSELIPDLIVPVIYHEADIKQAMKEAEELSNDFVKVYPAIIIWNYLPETGMTTVPRSISVQTSLDDVSKMYKGIDDNFIKATLPLILSTQDAQMVEYLEEELGSIEKIDSKSLIAMYNMGGLSKLVERIEFKPDAFIKMIQYYESRRMNQIGISNQDPMQKLAQQTELEIAEESTQADLIYKHSKEMYERPFKLIEALYGVKISLIEELDLSSESEDKIKEEETEQETEKDEGESDE